MARDASVQSIPAQFETTSATAAAVSTIFIYNRPLDYYAKLPDAYRKVTPADQPVTPPTDHKEAVQAFIDKRNFANYEDLHRFLTAMGENEYNRYLDAGRDFLHSPRMRPYTAEGFVDNFVANFVG